MNEQNHILSILVVLSLISGLEPADSRKRLYIAWAHVAAQYPDDTPVGTSRIQP